MNIFVKLFINFHRAKVLVAPAQIASNSTIRWQRQFMKISQHFKIQQTVIIENFRWIWIKFSTFRNGWWWMSEQRRKAKFSSSVHLCSVMIPFPVENHFHFSFLCLRGELEWAWIRRAGERAHDCHTRKFTKKSSHSCTQLWWEFCWMGKLFERRKFYSLKLWRDFHSSVYWNFHWIFVFYGEKIFRVRN